jgi:SAM-dependent methyltransferase
VKLDELLKLLAEPARLRLLRLLQHSELSVAELAHITSLKQPRVSTHLAKMKEAQLVLDRRAGVQAHYRAEFSELDATERSIIDAICAHTKEPLYKDDLKRLEKVLKARDAGSNWADQVAGDMERHYSPGRTWDAVARTAIELLQLGDVLDIASGDGAFAELIAPKARSLTCVDASAKVVQAATLRLAKFPHVRVLQNDMHALAFPNASFDLALMMQALPYAQNPSHVFSTLKRVLRPGGKLLGSALGKHHHQEVVAPYGHKNLGFSASDLIQLLTGAGFVDASAKLVAREKRSPHFDILIFTASCT